MSAAATRTVLKKRRARTRLDPEVRREQIIEAAELVLIDRDPADVTFEQIAEAAGVSRGLVYNYFGDKAGLLAAVYLRRFEQLDAMLARTLDATDAAPEHRLRTIVEVYLRFAGENPSAWRLGGTAEATEHPLVQQARRDHLQRLSASWAETPEARLLARGIFGFLEASTLAWLEEDELPADRAADVMLAQLWSGLAATDATGLARAGP
jgi:AcrR family transcriptional regulator